MHTFEGTSCRIHYNSDLSGDVTIVRLVDDPAMTISVSGRDLLRFAAEYVRDDRAGHDRATLRPAKEHTVSPRPLCSHLRRPASCILCYMDSPGGRLVRPSVGRGAADPILNDLSICRADSWSDPAGSPIDDILRAQQQMLQSQPRPYEPVRYREPASFLFRDASPAPTPTPALMPADWLDRMLAAPLPAETRPLRCVCGHPLCDGRRHE